MDAFRAMDEFRALLDASGIQYYIAHADGLSVFSEDREKKLVVQKKYYALLPQRYAGSGYTAVYSVDPNRLTVGVADMLAADDAVICQGIDKNTLKKLMSKEALKTYNRSLERRKAQTEKRRATLEKRRAAREQREIEKARKILAKAGVNVDA